jgi:hypothetical protein
MKAARIRIRSILLAAILTVAALLGGAVPAFATPVPSCSYHFSFIRHGTVVRVSAVELHVFSPAYMVVYAGAHGVVHGPYNAPPTGRTSFEIYTGRKAQTSIVISLTNPENTYTYCSSYYDA